MEPATTNIPIWIVYARTAVHRCAHVERIFLSEEEAEEYADQSFPGDREKGLVWVQKRITG